MTQKLLSLVIALSLAIPAHGANVAVVDSGTDFDHSTIRGMERINANDPAGNRIDDDRNGKVDDIVGWNFIDNYNRVFFTEHLEFYNPIIYPLFTIIAHRQAGIKNAQIEAPGSLFLPGTIYTLKIEHWIMQ